MSYQDIEQAAVSLLEDGLTPSIQRIRERLGTGSNSTIGAHLKRWQQALAQAPKAALPQAVPETVMAAVESFWQVAAAQAEAGYQDQRAQAEHRVAAAEHAAAEALAELGRAREQTATLEQRLIHSQAAGQAVQEDLLVERERRRLAEAAIAAAEQRADQAVQAAEGIRGEAQQHLAKLEERLEQTHREIEQRLAEAEQRLREERARNEASETRWLRIIDQNRLEHSAQRQAFAAERSAWQQRETALESQLATLRKESAALRPALAAAEERCHCLDTELGRARAAVAVLEAQQLATVTETASLQSALGVAQHQCRLLEDRLEAWHKALENGSAPPVEVPPPPLAPAGK